MTRPTARGSARLPVRFSARRGTVRPLLSFLLAGLISASASAQVTTGRDGWLYPQWERTDEVYAAGIDRGIDLIARGVGVLEAAGIHVRVGIMPAKARVYPEHLPAGTTVSPAFRALYADVNERLNARGVGTLDLLSPLMAGKDAQPMFARSDSHWSAYGADRAARAVAGPLAPLVAALPGKGPAGAVPAFVPTQITGDLARLAGRKEMEQIWIRTEPTERKLDLLDDDVVWGAKAAEAAPVIGLACTSLCEPPLGFPLVLSHALDKPVDLYWRYGNVGHWKILSGYLDSLKARRQPLPKLLIWIVMEGSLGSGPDDAAWADAGGRMAGSDWLAALEAAARGTP